MGNQNYTLKYCMTDAISNGIVADFKKVINIVFNNFMTDEIFDNKFINNIYGPSMLLVVYHKETAVAADALWRNDINGEEAYQTVDTCVLTEYRGQGLMRLITEFELNWVNNRIYYGFPNNQSHPAYLKIGLTEKQYYKTLLSPAIKRISINHEYTKWWISHQTGIYHIRFFGHYLLVNNKKRGIKKLVLGHVDKKTALLFPKLRNTIFIPLMISDKKMFILPSKPCCSVILNNTKKNTQIPLWKVDAI